MARPKNTIESSIGVASASDIKKALALIEDDESEKEETFTNEQLKEALESARHVRRELRETESPDMIERENEIDNMSDQCLSHFEDVIDKAFNAEDKHAAEMFNAATALLKTALDAKKAIIDARLKMEDLRLKEKKIDSDIDPSKSAINGSNDKIIVGDRNAIRNRMNK